MHRGQTYLTGSHSRLRYFCYFLISRQGGENNGFLAGVPLLLPPSRAISSPNSLPLSFRTPATQAFDTIRKRSFSLWVPTNSSARYNLNQSLLRILKSASEISGHGLMGIHVTEVCNKAICDLYSIRQIRKYLSEDATKVLVHAFVTSYLDHCNYLLFGFQNTKKRILGSCSCPHCLSGTKFSHHTPVLYNLQWLPVP